VGAVRLIYDETTNQLKRLGWWGELDIEGTRKMMQSQSRYCLQGNVLYLPQDDSLIDFKHRLCWGRIRSEEFFVHDWVYNQETEEVNFDVTLQVNPLDFHKPVTGIGFGAVYSKRHRETEEGRVPVKQFISQSIIDEIADNPEVLLDLTKTEFEELMAELFARMGFDIDLYRSTKDGGIDFLRVDTGSGDPIIFCVQCKHPDNTSFKKKRNPLSVATIREIYGVAKANDLHGAIAITSSTYTQDAKKFADLKPEEIQIADSQNILNWIKQYRWNIDE
jgi:restriction endonuclease Mrr